MAKLAAQAGAGLVGWIQQAAGAVPRNVEKKLRGSVLQSVEDFGAVADGVTNCTAAFAAARAATGGRYFLEGPGVYVVDAAPDVWADLFSAGPNTSIKIGGTTYNVSNAFAGPWRYLAGSNVLLGIAHAVTGNIVQQWQNGAGGTATYFYRGLSFKCDSHYIQAKPATLGGSCDMLWQRSDLHADANGNRFNQTFEEAADRLLLSYATTGSGAPAFDSAMALVAGLTPSMSFPGLPMDINQGWWIQTRAGGALKFGIEPGATKHFYKDKTSGNVLGSVTRSEQRFAGIGMDSMLDTPTGVIGPKRWGGVFSDLGGADGTLPLTKTILDTAGSTRSFVVGYLRAAVVPSGAAGGVREARFTFDGTTLSITDVVNTLPASFACTVIKSGTTLQISGTYNGSHGGGYTATVSVEFEYSGR